jgi:hypothetical protein
MIKKKTLDGREAIKPIDKASEAILGLKPVTFRYKHELDPEGIPHFGLVAEDVEKINAALVARAAEGKPYTVRYEAVNAMLLNEFLKEHRKNEEQQRQIEALTALVKEQATQNPEGERTACHRTSPSDWRTWSGEILAANRAEQQVR